MGVQHGPHQGGPRPGNAPDEDEGHVPPVLVGPAVRPQDVVLLGVHPLLGGQLLRRQAEHAQAEEEGAGAEEEEAADRGPPRAAPV